jgi:hypothetical protein
MVELGERRLLRGEADSVRILVWQMRRKRLVGAAGWVWLHA